MWCLLNKFSGAKKGEKKQKLVCESSCMSHKECRTLSWNDRLLLNNSKDRNDIRFAFSPGTLYTVERISFIRKKNLEF